MKHFCLILFVFLAFHHVDAQKGSYWEAGFLLGATNYSGDLTEKIIDLKATHPGYGAYLRYMHNRHLGFKAHVYSGAISGDDARSSTLNRRYFRFGTNIVELGAVAEWHIWNKERFSKTGLHKFYFYPYIYAGTGVAFASAEAEYYGPADLRNEILRVPLPEDGLSQVFLLAPMGAGLRFDIFERLIIGVEGGWRPVFSDDLDGIKLNGNPKSDDWYYFAGTTITFVLGRPKKR
jgi:hypothetical protein